MSTTVNQTEITLKNLLFRLLMKLHLLSPTLIRSQELTLKARYDVTEQLNDYRALIDSIEEHTGYFSSQTGQEAKSIALAQDEYLQILSITLKGEGEKTDWHPQPKVFTTCLPKCRHHFGELNIIDAYQPIDIPHALTQGENGVYNIGILTPPESVNTIIGHSVAFSQREHTKLYVVDMKSNDKLTNPQCQKIIKTLRQHDRYSHLLNDIPLSNAQLELTRPQEHNLFKALEAVSNHDMASKTPNLTVVVNFNKDDNPQWVNRVFKELTLLNRFCYGKILFVALEDD